MRSNARSDAVKETVAGIRRHATVIELKRQALAAASVACNRPDELCVVAYAYPNNRPDQQAATASATSVCHR
jgi:hypothetical protein